MNMSCSSYINAQLNLDKQQNAEGDILPYM